MNVTFSVNMEKYNVLYRSNAATNQPHNELIHKFEFKHVTGVYDFEKWSSTIESHVQRGREGVHHYFWF
jgi:hypothetical protein